MHNTAQRLALARKLHDGLAQELAAVGFELDGLIGDPTLDQAHRAELRKIRLEISRITDSFRDEIYLLRNLTRSEIESAIRASLTGLTVDIDMSYPEMNSECEGALGQALIEIARNAKAHSQGTHFTLRYSIEEGALIVMTHDNGKLGKGAISLKERSFGLRTIEESVALIGGTVTCNSSSEGTTYIVKVPLLSS